MEEPKADMKSKERTKRWLVGTVIAGLFSVLGAVVTNIDKVWPVVKEILGGADAESLALGGEWTGVFREYRKEARKEDDSEEVVNLVRKGSLVTGNITATRSTARRREIDGEFKHDFLIIKYFVAEPGRVGGVSYVLSGKPQSGLLRGYWLGYDPDISKMMTCPYVLAREKNVDRIKAEQRDWLDQRCSPPTG